MNSIHDDIGDVGNDQHDLMMVLGMSSITHC